MKRLSIALINTYQIFFSGIIHQFVGMPNACRFSPTCSEYTKQSISKHGILKGARFSFIRLLKCQPFYSPFKTLTKEENPA